MKDYVKDLYKKISENIGETPEEFHYDYYTMIISDPSQLPLQTDTYDYFMIINNQRCGEIGWNVSGYIG